MRKRVDNASVEAERCGRSISVLPGTLGSGLVGAWMWVRRDDRSRLGRSPGG
jgi:hypothetical protein